MTLKADIKYKSNWQQGGLKSKFLLKLGLQNLTHIRVSYTAE